MQNHSKKQENSLISCLWSSLLLGADIAKIWLKLGKHWLIK